MSNVYQKQIHAHPSAIQVITPHQTFGAHINTAAFLRPLATPLFAADYKHIASARTRNVLKLIRKDLIFDESILTEKPDDRPMQKTPDHVMSGVGVGSGDVVLGMYRGEVRRALVICQNERSSHPYSSEPIGNNWNIHKPREPEPEKDGFLVVWDEGRGRWGRRLKDLRLDAIRAAYEALGPEVCMALAARCSESAEVRMAGESFKLGEHIGGTFRMTT